MCAASDSLWHQALWILRKVEPGENEINMVGRTFALIALLQSVHKDNFRKQWNLKQAPLRQDAASRNSAKAKELAPNDALVSCGSLRGLQVGLSVLQVKAIGSLFEENPKQVDTYIKGYSTLLELPGTGGKGYHYMDHMSASNKKRLLTHLKSQRDGEDGALGAEEMVNW